MAENQLTVQVGQYSRKGAHDTNADSYGVMCPSGRTLELKGIAAAIADGMSTSTAAKEASETSVKSFLCDYLDAPESWAIKTAASRILSATNRWLHGQSHSRFENGMDMVTTFSGLILQGGEASIFHIGDSRIYRLRQGELKQLTRDHTLRSAGGHEHLAKALGADVHIAVDHRSEVLKSGDVFLFTTDGVHSVLSNQQLQETLATHCDDPDTCAKTIVEKADMAGSADDMSCQIIIVEEVGQAKEDTHLKALAELPFPPPLKAGMTLDGYRIIRELYASPRSQVYLVADEETGGKFVLKTPSDNFEDDATYLELFSREEWIAQTAASPNIVTAPTNNRPRNFLYTVFEYIEGQTLRQWLSDRQEPSLPDTRDIIAQIISGVRVLHRKEIIHQDLKPENILIDQEGTLKIVDFGSAYILGFENGSDTPERASNYGMGTIDYLAPEVVLGGKPSPASDLYSVAAIAYHMLTGKLPYGTGLNGKQDVQQATYISARRLNKNVPYWMDKALEKGVSVTPDNRQLALSELLQDLTAANPRFERQHTAFIEKNPVVFWKSCTGILILIIGALLF